MRVFVRFSLVVVLLVLSIGFPVVSVAEVVPLDSVDIASGLGFSAVLEVAERAGVVTAGVHARLADEAFLRERRLLALQPGSRAPRHFPLRLM